MLVLGAAGFIGSRMVRALEVREDVTEIVASDLRSPQDAPPFGAKVQLVPGDVLDPQLFNSLFGQPFGTIFHLAASLTLDAEADFARGLQVNVLALMSALEHCRAQSAAHCLAPKFLFASSISSFGGALPDVVDDFVFQTPQTSYGTHKAIAEQLINDYSRRGFIDARVLRLPIVLTHPGPPTSSVSDRIASLIREPLNGKDVVCPLAPETKLALASVDKVVEAFLALHDLPASVFSTTRVLNLPALTSTPGDLVAAVWRASGGKCGRYIWAQDAAMQRVVSGWPSAFTSAFAFEHGITGDASADAIVAAYLRARDSGI